MIPPHSLKVHALTQSRKAVILPLWTHDQSRNYACQVYPDLNQYRPVLPLALWEKGDLGERWLLILQFTLQFSHLRPTFVDTELKSHISPYTGWSTRHKYCQRAEDQPRGAGCVVLGWLSAICIVEHHPCSEQPSPQAQVAESVQNVSG